MARTAAAPCPAFPPACRSVCSDVVADLVGHEQRRQRDHEDDGGGCGDMTMTMMLRDLRRPVCVERDIRARRVIGSGRCVMVG